MKKHFSMVLFVLAFASLVYGAQQSKIELTDGSTLDGEVDSYSDGKYTIKTPNLGTLQIEKEKVRAIRSADPSAPAVTYSAASTAQPVPAAGASEIQKVQSAITSNPDIMKAIPGLLASPDFQALTKDPEIMNAAKTMNIQALLANPKLASAVNNPTIQEISRKIKEKNGGKG